jgi:hypothetical protein
MIFFLFSAYPHNHCETKVTNSTQKSNDHLDAKSIRHLYHPCVAKISVTLVAIMQPAQPQIWSVTLPSKDLVQAQLVSSLFYYQIKLGNLFHFVKFKIFNFCGVFFHDQGTIGIYYVGDY